VRDALATARPGDGVVGEEFGVTGEGARRWIIDPIDGTKSYLRGSPPWATLLGLEEDGALVLGVVSAPMLSRRWWATRGGGAFANGDVIAVSEVAALDDALLCHADVLSYSVFGCGPEFDALTQRVWDRRGFGDFWGHMLVAEGAADANLDAPGVTIWDLAAVQVVVEEAGGRFTDLAGERRLDGGSALSSNGHLHDAVLALLRA
jgi:histidinol-phosphatase